MKASRIIRALDADNHPESGRCRFTNTGKLTEPHEIFVKNKAGESFWIREHGRYVSGWRVSQRGPYSHEHFGRNYNRFDAWLIRRAVRRWLVRNGETEQ